MLELFAPWILLLGLGVMFFKLFGWARKKKTGTLVFGTLIQIFTPDPYVERTIEVVQESKKQIAGESRESDEEIEKGRTSHG